MGADSNITRTIHGPKRHAQDVLARLLLECSSGSHVVTNGTFTELALRWFGLVRWLNALSKRAGLERAVTPHLFRHATATELLARGAGLDVVKEMLGHASIRSTETYLHPDVGTQREAVERLGPIDLWANGELLPATLDDSGLAGLSDARSACVRDHAR
jgi:integrase